MKTPSEPTDPLLRSLSQDAAGLPDRAALEARKTRSVRIKQRRRLSLGVTAVMAGAFAWLILPSGEIGGGQVVIQDPPDAPLVLATPHSSASPLAGERLIVRTEEQARRDPLPMPVGLTRDQEDVVKAARGLPLLLVRDPSGKVVRVHVLER